MIKQIIEKELKILKEEYEKKVKSLKARLSKEFDETFLDTVSDVTIHTPTAPGIFRNLYKKKRKHNSKTTSPCISINSRRKSLQKPNGRKRIRNLYGNRAANLLMKLRNFTHVKLIVNSQRDSYDEKKIYKEVTIFPMSETNALAVTLLKENEFIGTIHFETSSDAFRILCSKFAEKHKLDIINSCIFENSRHKLIEQIPGISYTFEINNSGSVA